MTETNSDNDSSQMADAVEELSSEKEAEDVKRERDYTTFKRSTLEAILYQTCIYEVTCDTF